jgi:hypothetical protein
MLKIEMENRKAAKSASPFAPSPFQSAFCLFLSFSFYLSGCGVPGEPTPPSPPIPVAVTDLTARQVGDGVLLTFRPPSKSTLGQRLEGLPTLEVLRGSLRPDGLPDSKSFHIVDTVPGSLLGSYGVQGKVEFLDPVSPEEARALPGKPMVYRVRTRVSETKASADSNSVSVILYPVPKPIDEVKIQVTQDSIQLKWDPPTTTSAGEPPKSIDGYHVYRGELDPASADAAMKDLHAAVWKWPLLLLATTTVPEYQDGGFDFGKTYLYVVRSVVNAGGGQLESGDSRPAIVTPKDTFPPAAPQDVVAAVLPGATAGTSVVDLSWAINIETDLAGYRVYRSEREDERGQLLTADLLPTPAYRDSTVAPSHRYWYTVAAVDRAGNESPPSTPVVVEVP